MEATRTERRLVGAAEAARILDVSVWTIRRWARDGSLAAVKLNERSQLRFRRADLDQLVHGDPLRPDSRPAPATPARPAAGGRGGPTPPTIEEDDQ
jgi:excisionase family DNA binding protein